MSAFGSEDYEPYTGPRAWFWIVVHGSQNRWLTFLGATVCRLRGHRWEDFPVCTRCYVMPHEIGGRP